MDKQRKINNLFILDGIGAIVSAVMLGIVLVRFQPLFGIPISTLYLLAVIPFGFFCFDLYSRLSPKSDKSSLLRTIAIFNILYCVLSLGLALSHFEVITPLGWLYLIGEITVVVILSLYEIKVSKY